MACKPTTLCYDVQPEVVLGFVMSGKIFSSFYWLKEYDSDFRG